MKQGRTIYIFIIAVIGIPVLVFGITQWYQSRFERLPVLGPDKHVVGNFSFQDQRNENINLNNWKGKIVVAAYFFTSCPSVCPKLMNQLKRIQTSAAENVLINSFTVDPERDTVGRLMKYAEEHGIKANWLLLTGDKINLYRFARTDLMIVATDGDGGPADFIHSENLVLIDPQMRIRGYYKGTEKNEADRLIRDIGKLNREYRF